MDRRSFLAGLAAVFATAQVKVSPDTLASLAEPPPPVPSLLPRTVLSKLIGGMYPEEFFQVLQGRLPPLDPQRLATITFDEFFDRAPTLSRSTEYNEATESSDLRSPRKDFDDRIMPILRGGHRPVLEPAEREHRQWFQFLEEKAAHMADLHAVFDQLKAYPDPTKAAYEGLIELYGDDQEKRAALLAQFEGWPLTGGEMKSQQLTAQFAAERDFLFTVAEQKLPVEEANYIRGRYQKIHANFIPDAEKKRRKQSSLLCARCARKFF